MSNIYCQGLFRPHTEILEGIRVSRGFIFTHLLLGSYALFMKVFPRKNDSLLIYAIVLHIWRFIFGLWEMFTYKNPNQTLKVINTIVEAISVIGYLNFSFHI